ncbi:MAG TPA: CDP-glucose 4,6-dehydratase [Vicinamibacterales bacterium]
MARRLAATPRLNVLSVFDKKTVLVTGHTGFKGSWLSMWLTDLGARVVGVSRDVPTEPSHFEAIGLAELVEDVRLDIDDFARLRDAIHETRPDFVFHLAAQALVRRSYAAPLETFVTNAIGSAHVLEALRSVDWPVTMVMITSDKAYDNVETAGSYREGDRLGGRDPYSASKAMAELVTRAYVASFLQSPASGVRVVIGRAGNVIGGGDWAADRIVPDCVRAWSQGAAIDVRHPCATRPWQHVLESLSGYLTLAARASIDATLHGEAFNFGPPSEENHTVRELIAEIGAHWSGARSNEIPAAGQELHEARQLRLNCEKAHRVLRWQATFDFRAAVRVTAAWYEAFYGGHAMRPITRAQIRDYTRAARTQGQRWAAA